MAEVLVEYPDFVRDEDGQPYVARACGAPNGNGMWQGWIEFVRLDGGHAVRSARETTQPNRQDTLYWATGLTPVYLEGALHRALTPLVRPPASVPTQPYFDGPAPDAILSPPAIEAVLNPFSVYRKGESLLRAQLNALSPWHLVNIIRAHELSDQDPMDLNLTSTAELVELILASVRIPNKPGRRSSSDVGDVTSTMPTPERETRRRARKGKHGARSTKQAISTGQSKARRSGVKRRRGAAATRQKGAQDVRAGQRGGRKRSAKRARSVKRALEREGRAAASRRAH